jgi:hypothetical protein
MAGDPGSTEPMDQRSSGESPQWWLSCLNTDREDPAYTGRALPLGVVIVQAPSFLEAVQTAQVRGVLPAGPLDAHDRPEENDNPDEPATYICRSGGHIHIKGFVMAPDDHVGPEWQNRLLGTEAVRELERSWRNRPRRPATFHDLDQMAHHGCSDPGCQKQHAPLETVFLHSRCHPNVGLWARYSVLRRTVLLLCRKCRKPLAEIAVGDRWRGDILPGVVSDPASPGGTADLE